MKYFFSAVFFIYEIIWITLFRFLDFALRFQSSKQTLHQESFKSKNSKGLSIVVLNFNGINNLKACLKSIDEASKYVQKKSSCEVIFVDNGSTDESKEFVSRNFPNFKIISLTQNISFAAANNLGVRKSIYDKVIVISNDMLVEKSSFLKLLDAINTSQSFAISPQQFFWDTTKRREETGLTRLFLHFGKMDILHKDLQGRSKKLLPVFWAGAGFSIYDRDKFLELHGFSQLYAPIYWEDVDLSYRAWRRGWESAVLPEVHVLHKHQGTTRKIYQQRYLTCLKSRNEKIFFLANIFDWDMLYPLVQSWIRQSISLYVKESDTNEIGVLIQLSIQSLRLLKVRRQERTHVHESDQITFWKANGHEFLANSFSA